jgi:hypothetical protein
VMLAMPEADKPIEICLSVLSLMIATRAIN